MPTVKFHDVDKMLASKPAAEEAEAEETAGSETTEATSEPEKPSGLEGWLKESLETDERATSFQIEVDPQGAEVNLASAALLEVLDDKASKVSVAAVDEEVGATVDNEPLGAFEIPASWQ